MTKATSAENAAKWCPEFARLRCSISCRNIRSKFVDIVHAYIYILYVLFLEDLCLESQEGKGRQRGVNLFHRSSSLHMIKTWSSIYCSQVALWPTGFNLGMVFFRHLRTWVALGDLATLLAKRKKNTLRSTCLQSWPSMLVSISPISWYAAPPEQLRNFEHQSWPDPTSCSF